MSAAETKLTGSENFSQCHSTVNFCLQVPENTQNLKDQRTARFCI